MNCREAQQQIFAERDGATSPEERAALDRHLAHCDACQKVSADLAAALVYWQTGAANTGVPDAEREWQAVRRRIRGGPTAPSPRVRPSLLGWVAVPLAAAAALVFAVFRDPAPTAGTLDAAPVVPQVARVDSVEAPGSDASTMVYVDDKSGWVIVLASDAAPKRG